MTDQDDENRLEIAVKQRLSEIAREFAGGKPNAWINHHDDHPTPALIIHRAKREFDSGPSDPESTSRTNKCIQEILAKKGYQYNTGPTVSINTDMANSLVQTLLRIGAWDARIPYRTLAGDTLHSPEFLSLKDIALTLNFVSPPDKQIEIPREKKASQHSGPRSSAVRGA